MNTKLALLIFLLSLSGLGFLACGPSADSGPNALIPLPSLGWDKADDGMGVSTTDGSGNERILGFDAPVSGELKPGGAFDGWFVEALPGSHVRIRLTPAGNPDVRFFVFGPANREDGVENYSLKIAWPGPAGQEVISDCIDGKLDEDDDWGLMAVIAYQFECMVEYADSLKEAGGVQTADASLTGGRYLVLLGTFDGEKGGAYTLQMSCNNQQGAPCACSFNQQACDSVCIATCLEKSVGQDDGCGALCGQCSMDLDCSDFGPEYFCSSQTGMCEFPECFSDAPCGANMACVEGKCREPLCDGNDDNDDGLIDNGCVCISGDTRDCGSNVGECFEGFQECQDGFWSECYGAYGPFAEICGNGADDDCDGATDEEGCCGDGILDLAEQCDGDVFGNIVCAAGETRSCDGFCQVVCTAP